MSLAELSLSTGAPLTGPTDRGGREWENNLPTRPLRLYPVDMKRFTCRPVYRHLPSRSRQHSVLKSIRAEHHHHNVARRP
jgi:hypothetical protein